jgi:hypothetical protein
VLGVSLASGTPSGSGPMLDVGTGGFPYELTANMAWRAGVAVDPGLTPIIPTQPQAGWSSNWSNNLALSGSGLEGLGASDIPIHPSNYNEWERAAASRRRASGRKLSLPGV